MVEDVAVENLDDGALELAGVDELDGEPVLVILVERTYLELLLCGREVVLENVAFRSRGIRGTGGERVGRRGVEHGGEGGRQYHRAGGAWEERGGGNIA